MSTTITAIKCRPILQHYCNCKTRPAPAKKFKLCANCKVGQGLCVRLSNVDQMYCKQGHCRASDKQILDKDDDYV